MTKRPHDSDGIPCQTNVLRSYQRLPLKHALQRYISRRRYSQAVSALEKLNQKRLNQSRVVIHALLDGESDEESEALTTKVHIDHTGRTMILNSIDRIQPFRTFWMEFDAVWPSERLSTTSLDTFNAEFPSELADLSKFNLLQCCRVSNIYIWAMRDFVAGRGRTSYFRYVYDSMEMTDLDPIVVDIESSLSIIAHRSYSGILFESINWSDVENQTVLRYVREQAFYRLHLLVRRSLHGAACGVVPLVLDYLFEKPDPTAKRFSNHIAMDYIRLFVELFGIEGIEDLTKACHPFYQTTLKQIIHSVYPNINPLFMTNH